MNRAQFSLRRWNLGADPNFENTMEQAPRINDRLATTRYVNVPTNGIDAFPPRSSLAKA